MLVALLAVLGVDLIWIVILVVILLTRRAWLSRQPGAFKGEQVENWYDDHMGRVSG